MPSILTATAVLALALADGQAEVRGSGRTLEAGTGPAYADVGTRHCRRPAGRHHPARGRDPQRTDGRRRPAHHHDRRRRGSGRRAARHRHHGHRRLGHPRRLHGARPAAGRWIATKPRSSSSAASAASCGGSSCGTRCTGSTCSSRTASRSRANDILGPTEIVESARGNGIHLFNSTGNRLIRNRVRATRDGIYFSFASGNLVVGNEVTRSPLRAALHVFGRQPVRATTPSPKTPRARRSCSPSGSCSGEKTFSRHVGYRAYGLLLQTGEDILAEGQPL